MVPLSRLFSCSLAIAFSTFTFFFNSSADDAPLLVIDHQGHSGAVGRLIFTSDGKQIISVGKDKTIRVWDTDTGTLQRTIRTEIGDGTDGKHYAGALSPDDRWLAVAGWASTENDDYGAIRVIDLRDDSMAAVLRGHTDVVHSLAFSDDGRTLVSGSGDSSAKVWDVAHWSDAAADAEVVQIDQAQTLEGHTDKVYAVAITADGLTVITGSFDATLRIWKRNAAGEKFTETAVLKGHPAFVTALDATADGSTIVSGDGNGRLLFWDGTTGKLRGTLDDSSQFVVGTISISPDEKKVLASSKTGNGGNTTIYSLATGKSIQSYDHHDNTVTSSAWHPQKPLIATSGGINNEILLFLERDGSVIHQLVGTGDTYWNVAIRTENALEIALGTVPPDPATGAAAGVQMAFDLTGLQTRPITDSNDSMRFYGLLTNFDGQSISGTGDELQIGNLGTIKPDEGSYDKFRVASFTRDGKSVIVGSTYFLRRYVRKNGKFVVATEYTGHEGSAIMIAESADGKYLVSSSLDQTVRLWNIKTGDLLVSFVSSSSGEWVCWTPDGYFSASPEGGKLIGWHFNRGIDKVSDYVSGDQLYDHFSRPDIVKKTVVENRPSSGIVRGLGLEFDLKKAISSAPGVELAGLQNNSTASAQRITVMVEGIDNGGGVAGLRLYHEGKLLSQDGPGSMRNGRFQVPFTVSLLSGANEIRAIALTPGGVESKPETITVNFEGSKASARLFLLAVGINEYKNPRLHLDYCRPDVDAFTEAFRKGSGKLFTEIVVHKLYDEDATAEAIIAKLKEIAAVSTPDDVFVFNYAGHGSMSDGDDRNAADFYLIPYDVTQTQGNDSMLVEKGLSGSQIRELSALIPARKQLMVMDACQSGGLVETFAMRGAQEERALAQLARSSGMYVLASTRSEQFATEAKELGHGLFTYALLEALEGKGDFNGDGKITVKEVEAWLNERVPELSEKHTGAAQYPNSFARGQDFPIGIID